MQFKKEPGTAKGLKIHYLIGDATQPVQKPAVIAHVCNNIGGFGRGFVVALKNRWPITEQKYKELFQFKKEDFPYKAELGYAQIFPVEEGKWVSNMIAQEGIRWVGKVPPIRYQALKQALEATYKFAKDNGLTVHMPRIGAVLSGGDWGTIEEIIQDTMTVDTYVYTLENQKDRWKTQYEN